jgi:uncharacterized protein YndB with AHSA1/START domain
MPLKKDPTGRRWVEVSVEVPGTPQEVWEAIATGPGVSSWFVPCEVKSNPDGRPREVICNFGPGMESVAQVTGWDPPRRFTADSADFGPEMPSVATEWIVEARAGGTCVVRVVHSMFTDKDDWDNQLEGFESGWPSFFRILKLYLTHFRGQHGTPLQLVGGSNESEADAWARFTTALGLDHAAVGEHRRAPAGAPALGSTVEVVSGPHGNEFLLKLDQPAPGVAHLFAMPMGGQVMLIMRLYLYGGTAAATVERENPLWQAWIAERFPMG